MRDAESTIVEALASLQVQTLDDFEVLVVDDGSRDQSAQLVDAIAMSDARVRLLSQPATGIVGALTRAAREARGTFFARMDADDIALPERLATQVRWLRRRGDLAVVGSRVQSFGETPATDGWRRYEAWLNGRCRTDLLARDLLVESPLAHPSVMMRREAFYRVGGYRDFDGPEDYDLWLRLARAGYRFAKVPRVLLRWRDHAARLTRTDGRYRAEAFLRLKIDHLLAGPLSDEQTRPVLIWGAGRDGGRFARELLARGGRVDAFIDIDPRRKGRLRHDRPVLMPSAIADFARPIVLGVVPVLGARALIRQRLTKLGLRELVDYWVCA
jgi:glycosyltransferase involved in cell wall biosynthesis